MSSGQSVGQAHVPGHQPLVPQHQVPTPFPQHLMLCLHFASTRTSTRICRTGFSRRSCPISWLSFLDTAAPKAKAKAKVKAKSKVKAKAAGKAKAAASKAPGVTSSPMKAQKAKAKSTMKKNPEKTWCSWRRKPRPKRRLSRRWQQDGRRPGMSQFLMTMQKEKMRSLKEDATVADDEHWSYPKVRKCARMIKSGQVPEDLQQLYEEGSKHSPPQGYLRVSSSTKSFSLSAEHQRWVCVCSWKYPVFEVFKNNSEICTNKCQFTGLA